MPVVTTTPPTATTATASTQSTAEPTTPITPINSAAPKPEEPKISYASFSEDELSQAILADLALQRGATAEGLRGYAELARATNNISLLQRTARIASGARQPALAIEMAERWLQQAPTATDARQLLAYEQIALGRYREALSHFTTLLEQGANVDFRLVSARIASLASSNNPTGKLNELIADYDALILRYPQNHVMQLSLTHLHQLNGNPEQALVLLQQLERRVQKQPAANAQPNNQAIRVSDLIVLEAQLLDQLQQPARSLKRLQQGVKADPTHKELRYRLGRRLIVDRNFSEAQGHFSTLVEQNPTDYDLLYSLALLSMENNRYADAKNYLQRLVLNGQRLDDAHYYLGFIDAQENQAAQAIDHYLLVKGGSNYQQTLRNLSELMIQQDRYNELHAHLQNIRFRNADLNIPLLSMEANALVAERRFTEAKTLLDTSLASAPNNVDLLFARSVLSDELNDLAFMEADLRKIIELEPQSPVAYNSLGYTLADRTTRYQDAYDLIKKAIALSPDDPAIIDSLGWVQYKLGLLQEARSNLDRAYQLFPDAEVAAHLGEVLWMLGDKPAATKVWREALTKQPDSAHLKDTMQRLTAS
jgi:tetratricopeptide (TPR) repeat protein